MMPYENATSGEKALGEIQKILQRFGCQSFGHMMNFDRGELIVQFRHRDVPVMVRASLKGYAAAWLKENPWKSAKGGRPRTGSEQEHNRKAMEIGGTAVYSVLRDWIKGQITAVETGIMSFEGAFLGQIMLPGGETILDKVQETKMLQIGGGS